MSTAFFWHQDAEQHDMGHDHPESPARLRAILDRLQQSGLGQELDWHTPEEVTRKQLELAHAVSYLDQLEQMAPTQGRIMADPDTAMTPFTLRAAKLAAGAAVQAVDAVMSGQAKNAFVAMRPPGHHAERAKTMGFCFYNNIAIAAQHALNFHHLDRVAIVDFDVHQGNGTIDIFRHEPRVMICSSFQHPFYPHTPMHDMREGIVNTPLAAGSRGSDFRRAVEHHWLPNLMAFKPQLILVSAGFDAHRDDPLADLRFENRDYRWITNMINDVARMHARGRVVSLLEGGYNLDVLADGAEAHVQELLSVGKGGLASGLGGLGI